VAVGAGLEAVGGAAVGGLVGTAVEGALVALETGLGSTAGVAVAGTGVGRDGVSVGAGVSVAAGVTVGVAEGAAVALGAGV
jgi:hypothetical protein